DNPACKGAPRARDARWVRPRLVAQVEFTEWTADGKLRHPSFQGLRADKQPMETVREEPVAVPKRQGRRAPDLSPRWVSLTLRGPPERLIALAQALRGMFDRLRLPSLPAAAGKSALGVHVP